MTPVDFPGSNLNLLGGSNDVADMRVFTDGEVVISKIQLTWKERFQVLFTGHVWHHVLTWGNGPYPMKISADYPDEL